MNLAGLRRVVFYDLETSIVARRAKTSREGLRRNLIVEIAAVCTLGRTFHHLVDPRARGETLEDTFARTGQNPDRTLRFWTKLFVEKNLLHKRTRAQKKHPVEQRLQAFDLLFDGEAFVPAKLALARFAQFNLDSGDSVLAPLLVAHNGASFDHPILRAYAQNTELVFDPACMHDSLKPARHIMPGMKSHSLGSLHSALVGSPFRAHHALDDARALKSVCEALALKEGVSVPDLWSPTHGSLTSLRGVGPKTARALRRAGYTLPTLRAAVRAQRLCPEELKPCIRNHKSLWRNLRNKWVRRSQREGGEASGAPRTRARSKSL